MNEVWDAWVSPGNTPTRCVESKLAAPQFIVGDCRSNRIDGSGDAMRVLVLGAGVVGVTTAFQLLKDGHEVTVVDRAEEVASFSSHANAGLVAPGHAYAWSSPRAPGMMLRSLYRKDQAIRFRPSLNPALWLWSLKFLQQCTAERALVNTQQKSRICTYSQPLKGNRHRDGYYPNANDGGLLIFTDIRNFRFRAPNGNTAKGRD